MNESTLRAWTDAGKVRAFVTPGGHRRYLEEDLLGMTKAHSVNSPDNLHQLLVASRERYETLSRQSVQSAPWFQNFDQEARRKFRIMGNSVLSLLSAYLTGGGRERAHALAEGREVAAQYGQEAADLGLTLTQATEAFLLFRTPVLEAVNQWIREQPARSLQAGETLRRLNQFMDQLLLAMASAHEARSTERNATDTPADSGASADP